MMSIRAALNNKRAKNKRRYNKNKTVNNQMNNSKEEESPDMCNVGTDEKKVEILVEMQDVIDSVNRVNQASSGVITNNIGPD